MSKTAIRRLFVSLYGGLIWVAALSAHSAKLTLDDPNCDSFTLNGTAPNQTITCVVSQAPTCTISGLSSGVVGSPVTLTANCSGAPSTWSWSGGTCANGNTANFCDATSTTAGTVTYTVAATNGVGAGPASPGKAVTWSTTPPPAPTGCTITANPTSLPAGGGAVTLTAACTTGSPTSYTWTGGTIAGTTTTNVIATNITGTTTFTVTPSNGTNGNTASVNVTVASPPGAGAIQCTGYDKTLVIDLPWKTTTQETRPITNGFSGTTALVVRFTVPLGVASTGAGQINAAEWGGGGVYRQATLTPSTARCDFSQTPGAPLYNATYPGNTPYFWLTVGGAQQSNKVLLQPGQTYHFSIRNVDSWGNNSCPVGNCEMVIGFSKPPGT